jgi:hypothetical protein
VSQCTNDGVARASQIGQWIVKSGRGQWSALKLQNGEEPGVHPPHLGNSGPEDGLRNEHPFDNIKALQQWWKCHCSANSLSFAATMT